MSLLLAEYQSKYCIFQKTLCLWLTFRIVRRYKYIKTKNCNIALPGAATALKCGGELGLYKYRGAQGLSLCTHTLPALSVQLLGKHMDAHIYPFTCRSVCVLAAPHCYDARCLSHNCSESFYGFSYYTNICLYECACCLSCKTCNARTSLCVPI